MKKFRVSPEWAARLCAGATLGFLMSLYVHVLTQFEISPFGGSRWVFLLHVALFLFFFPMVFDQYRLRDLGWRRSLALFPGWAYFLALTVFVYVQVMARLSFTPPVSETAVAKEIRFLRGFSSAWLLFYLLPALYFFWVPRVLREQGGKAA